MENPSSSFRLDENSESIFDELESEQIDPEIFDWRTPTNEDNMLFAPCAIIQRPVYIINSINTQFKKIVFRLVPRALLRLKKNTKDVVKYLIRLKNPRIETIFNQTSQMYGFALIGYKGRLEFFVTDHLEKKKWMRALVRVAILTNIQDKYSFGQIIGQGNFAKVQKATLLYKTPEKQMKFAVKTIKKSLILKDKKNKNSLLREIDIMREIDHPGIIKLYEVYESPYYVHLVMEYLSGGELFKLIQDSVVYTEQDAALLIRNVLNAIEYLHTKNIVHRDIKPENLILKGDLNKYDIKIVDFGLATRIKPGIPEYLRCGSPGYVAPEVLRNRGYDTKADIFSIGVILYALLSGNSPFRGLNVDHILTLNEICDISFPKLPWLPVSKAAKGLTSLLLGKEPRLRPTATQALANDWFNTVNQNLKNLTNVRENIKTLQTIESQESPRKCPDKLIMQTPVMNRRNLNESSPLQFPSKGLGLLGGLHNKDEKDKYSLNMKESEDYSDFIFGYINENEDYDTLPIKEIKEDEERNFQVFTPGVSQKRKLPRVAAKGGVNYLSKYCTPLIVKRGRLEDSPSPKGYFGQLFPKNTNNFHSSPASRSNSRNLMLVKGEESQSQFKKINKFVVSMEDLEEQKDSLGSAPAKVMEAPKTPPLFFSQESEMGETEELHIKYIPTRPDHLGPEKIDQVIPISVPIYSVITYSNQEEGYSGRIPTYNYLTCLDTFDEEKKEEPKKSTFFTPRSPRPPNLNFSAANLSSCESFDIDRLPHKALEGKVEKIYESNTKKSPQSDGTPQFEFGIGLKKALWNE